MWNRSLTSRYFLFVVADDTTSGPSADNSESGTVSGSLKILSYNVWFREDLEMHPRMKTIGDLIQLHSPDIICFQVTGIIFPTFVNEL